MKTALGLLGENKDIFQSVIFLENVFQTSSFYIYISFRSGEQPIEEEEKEKPKSNSQCRQYLNSDNRASLFKVFKWTG